MLAPDSFVCAYKSVDIQFNSDNAFRFRTIQTQPHDVHINMDGKWEREVAKKMSKVVETRERHKMLN